MTFPTNPSHAHILYFHFLKLLFEKADHEAFISFLDSESKYICLGEWLPVMILILA